MSTQKFVGIVERNVWEAETFGYYWPWSQEAETLLREVVERYHAQEEFSFRLDIATHSDLVALDADDDNGYLPRVSVYQTPASWPRFIAKIAPPGDNDEPNPFYKGGGLPRKSCRIGDWVPAVKCPGKKATPSPDKKRASTRA